MYSAHITHVTWSRASAFHWEQMPLSRAERRQQLFPALLSHTCTTAVHTYRHSCWQPSSPGIIQGWVLSNKAKIRGSVGAPDACQHCCSRQRPIQRFLLFRTWDNWCKTCLISLHLACPSSFTPGGSARCPVRNSRWLRATRPGQAAGERLGGGQKGQVLQHSGETETWKVIHLSTGKRRTRIRTVPWLQ